MPAFKFTNPFSSLDLSTIDLRKIDLRKAAAPATKIARDVAYVAVGVGVIATQRVTARRYDAAQRLNTLQTRVTEAMPRVRDEAQATAERFFNEASDKVRGLIERRKNVAAKNETDVA